MKKIIIILTIFMSVLLSAKTSKKDMININFVGLQLMDFVKMVAKIKHENILVDQKARGVVNFISVKPIPKSSLLKLLNSVLETKGLTMIRTPNGYLKVVRIADAGRSGLPVNEYNDNTFQIVTEIIEVDDINVDLLITKLRHLVTKNSKITTSKETNAIIITDYPDKIKSIKKIIKLLISKNKQTVKVLSLRHIKANIIGSDIIKITRMLYDPKIVKNKIEIIPNNNTNTITLVGQKEKINVIAKLIKNADKKGDRTLVIMELISLKNSNAADVIAILNKFFANSDKNAIYHPQFMNEDELNAIIIRARREDINNIKQLIKKLDIVKSQVYVRAKIIEISDDLASNVGVKYGLISGKVSSSALTTMAGNLSETLKGNALTDSTALGMKLGDNEITKMLALKVIVDLMEGETAANVLSEPSLLCSNNKESEIYVGTTQSFKTGSNSAATTAVTYKREDIGITLNIKPRLSNDNKVTLEIKVTIEDILGLDKNEQPMTTKRTINTTAIVGDGQLVLLGGLTKAKETNTDSRIPVLGSIPYLGRLFSHNVTENKKTTLAIMLTPYILDEQRSLSELNDELDLINSIKNKILANIKRNHDNGDKSVNYIDNNFNATYKSNEDELDKDNNNEEELDEVNDEHTNYKYIEDE